MMHQHRLAPELQQLLCVETDSDSHRVFADEAAQLLSVRQRVYAPDSTIVHQGDPSNTVRVVRSGWVISAVELENGTRQIIDVFLKGDIIEPMTIGRLSHVSLHAVDYVTVLEFPFEGIGLLLARWPDKAQHLAAATARLRAIRMERIVSLGRRDATKRTAHLFLELAERSVSAPAGPTIEFECPLTQADVADILGMTAIHINRTLRELRELQYVTFRNGSVVIHEKRRLGEFAGFNSGYLKKFGDAESLV